MISKVNVRCQYDNTIKKIYVNIPEDKTKCLAFGCECEGMGQCIDCYKRIQKLVSNNISYLGQIL